MGMRALQKFSVHHLLSTNRAESFNALLKRNFPKHRGYTEDQILLGGNDIIRGQLIRINRARFGIGEKWLLRDHLRSTYSIYPNNYNPQQKDIEEGSLSKRLDKAESFQLVSIIFYITGSSNVNFMFFFVRLMIHCQKVPSSLTHQT